MIFPSLRAINRNILQRRHRLILFGLVMINIFGAAAEAMTVYLVLPVLGYLNNPDDFDIGMFFVPPLRDFALLFENVAMGMFVLVLICFLIKAIMMSVCAYLKHAIIGRIRCDVSTTLFKSTLNQNYIGYINTKISIMMNNATAGVSHLFNGIVLSAVNILIELIIILGIGIVLVMNTSLFSMIVPLIIGSFTAVLIIGMRQLSKRLGEMRQVAESGRLQVLRETFSAFHEIKLYQSEDFFLKDYKSKEEMFRRAGIGVMTIVEAPKYIMELIGILAIFGFFVLSLITESTDNLLIMNGLYAVAIIKLMPSFNKIIISMNNMKAAIPAFNEVAEVFFQSTANANPMYSAKIPLLNNRPKRIVINDIAFRYHADMGLIFDGLSLEINTGETLGLIGESGSGKTTLLNIVAGIVSPERGQFFINGQLTQDYHNSISPFMSYVPQNSQLFNKSILENIAFDNDIDSIDRTAVVAALKSAEAYQFVEKLEHGVDTMLSDNGMNLSGGQRQRLCLARALYRNPALIILDEATNALDTRTESAFMKTIRQLSKDRMLLIVSHSENMMKYCDRHLIVTPDAETKGYYRR